MAAKVTTTLTQKKQTKGTVVFENGEDGAPVSSLYVMKSAFEGDSFPEKITLTIEPAK